MEDNFNNLYCLFLKIRKKGWIRSLRKGPTGVGYTFERLIGKDEDALSIPDFNGIEIKTHRLNSKSHITLFCCNPRGNSSYELKRIFDCYHYYNPSKCVFALNTSVYCGSIKDVGINYKFSLKVDENQRKVFLIVFDRLGNFIDDSSFWTFDSLENKLYNKIRYLAFVEVMSKFCYNKEYFKYDRIKFYVLKDFGSFIRLLKEGKVRITFKISELSSSKIKGLINSHGTSFDISCDNIELLYDNIIF
jgi:hypothetical protein